MKIIRDILLGLAAVALIIGVGVYLLRASSQESVLAGDSGAPNVLPFAIESTASSTVGVTSTLIVASSSARIYTAIVNDSGNTVYISLGSPAVSGMGIRLNASGGSYEIDGDNLWQGAIYGIASGNSNVTLTTFQQ